MNKQENNQVQAKEYLVAVKYVLTLQKLVKQTNPVAFVKLNQALVNEQQEEQTMKH